MLLFSCIYKLTNANEWFLSSHPSACWNASTISFDVFGWDQWEDDALSRYRLPGLCVFQSSLAWNGLLHKGKRSERCENILDGIAFVSDSRDPDVHQFMDLSPSCRTVLLRLKWSIDRIILWSRLIVGSACIGPISVEFQGVIQKSRTSSPGMAVQSDEDSWISQWTHSMDFSSRILEFDVRRAKSSSTQSRALFSYSLSLYSVNN